MYFIIESMSPIIVTGMFDRTVDMIDMAEAIDTGK